MRNEDKIISIIVKQSVVSEQEISKNDLLVVLGIDSLKMVELIVALEDELGITFDDSELDPMNLTTVEAIINLANKYLNV